MCISPGAAVIKNMLEMLRRTAQNHPGLIVATQQGGAEMFSVIIEQMSTRMTNITAVHKMLQHKRTLQLIFDKVYALENMYIVE